MREQADLHITDLCELIIAKNMPPVKRAIYESCLFPKSVLFYSLYGSNQAAKRRVDTAMSKQIEITDGPIGAKILQYAAPLAATGILQQLFNAADLAVVGQLPGEFGKSAMAAVGGNAPVIGLLVNLFVGIALGSNVVIANSIGRRDGKTTSKAVHTSIIFALLGGVAMTLLGEWIAGYVVKLLDVPPEVFDMAVKYLRIYFLGMPVILLYNFESAIFRSCGNTRIPLIALAVSGILNVILNLFFVMGLHMDVDGVAAATVISNLISAVILFVCLTRGTLTVKVYPRQLGIDGKTLWRILRIGIPAGVQSAIFSLANIVIQTSVNSLGTTVMAASSAAYNLEIFSYYVMNSFGQACTTFVGQNYGAGKNDRCRRTLKLSLIQSFLATAAVCLLILLSGRTLLSVFNSDPEVIEIGYIRLEYIFLAYAFSFAQEIFSGYLRGFGISSVPALCSVLGICGVRLGWMFTVFKRYPTFSTIMQVYPISLGVTAAVTVLVTAILRPSRRYQIQREKEMP